MSRKTVVLVGALDTKGAEYRYLSQRIKAAGVQVLLLDVGTLDPPTIKPDITRQEIAAAVGIDVNSLAAEHDRGAAVSAMADAAMVFVTGLHKEGRCDAVLAAGGSCTTTIATKVMRGLPVGIPKVMVSSVAAGDVREYVGISDLTLMASVTDVAGLNFISARILANAAAAIVGMVTAPPVELAEHGATVGATMFGVTTPCVTAARGELERRGYEVLTFHATGTGGRALEALIDSGSLQAVLDVTTTELCDELVGGVLSAGPGRLEAAGRMGLPQVVSLGGLDMVNFGSPETVPECFQSRKLYAHNPHVTLMRTSPAECAELGRQIGRKLSAARGPVALFIPLRGVSAISGQDGPFHDPSADDALFTALRQSASGHVDINELDLRINDPAFAIAMAEKIDEYLGGRDDR